MDRWKMLTLETASILSAVGLITLTELYNLVLYLRYSEDLQKCSTVSDPDRIQTVDWIFFAFYTVITTLSLIKAARKKHFDTIALWIEYENRAAIAIFFLTIRILKLMFFNNCKFDMSLPALSVAINFLINLIAHKTYGVVW